MSEATQIDVNNIPLDQIDVSDPTIYQNDCWQPFFKRLRSEAPVHYQAESPVGAFWSVSSHELIKQVDTNPKVFSSELGGIAIPDRPGRYPGHRRRHRELYCDGPAGS